MPAFEADKDGTVSSPDDGGEAVDVPTLEASEADHLEQITEVLLSIARGDFSARVPRDRDGSRWDVLAFMVNATAEEVAHLVEQLREERRTLAEVRDQLVQSEKLAALGELAGGVAHELNQPLTAILTVVELLRDRPTATIAENLEDLDLIHLAASRMGRIVSAVRTFGRRAPLQLSDTDLREPLDSALALLSRPLASADVEVEVISEGEVPRVQADSDALQQVFINLLSNACHALEELPESRSRRIEIRLGRKHDSVCLSVVDSGNGIADEDVGKIFDPFFTTKAVGQGAGLGLSISHGLVSKHGGTLRYSTGPGGGSRFVVELPLAAADDAPAAGDGTRSR